MAKKEIKEITSSNYMNEELSKRINETENKARILNEYEAVRNSIIDRMKWDTMDFHDKDDDHEERYFTPPEKDDYRYPRYVAINELLSVLDKAVIGG